VDKELLEQYHQGLIALTSCIGGEVPQLILGGRLQEAKQAVLWYKQTFGDFYLEIQRHPIPELEQINQELISMSGELDIPLVAGVAASVVFAFYMPFLSAIVAAGALLGGCTVRIERDEPEDEQ